MTRTATARQANRSSFPRTAVGLTLVVAVTIVVTAVHQSASWATSPSGEEVRGDPGVHGRSVTRADGVLPGGVTVFEDRYPGVAKLDPRLLRALRDAATEAAGGGIEFHVNSGWRSPAYQRRLLREAVATYGSRAEAARWVATPRTSAHVEGDAVDVGPPRAAAWLAEHGAAYGLCRVYGNEPWHYELRPEAAEHGCPAVYADPTHDPRMKR